MNKRGLRFLGYNTATAGIVQQALGSNKGLLLIAGPTGCGKSHTVERLIALRAESLERQSCIVLNLDVTPPPMTLMKSARKQNGGVKLTKSQAVFTDFDALNHDLCVIDEIRSAHHARVAIETTLMGITTIASIHAPSIPGAYYRLLSLYPDATIELNAGEIPVTVVNQRLLSVPCKHCVRKAPLSHLSAKVRRAAKEVNTTPAGLGEGCTKCLGTGRSGRVLVAEGATLTPEMRLSIGTGCAPQARAAWRENKGPALCEHAIERMRHSPHTVDAREVSLLQDEMS
jgi:type II secretory ATPase GspE/PulE/Tfp pilus assembly ATPase PilB-like protein